MDRIRQKAQSLLEKLHNKYGVQTKHHIHVVLATMGKKEGENADLQDHWYLVDTHGQKFRLPKTMLFLGSDECDVIVASQSVDKRHAILAFDIYLNRFKVKDLSTRNGTFVNNSRIPEQEYVALNHMDSIRLGQDAMMYHMEQGSQITSHGGLLPDPHFIPSWANRSQDTTTTIHVHAHDLAECQGCIAEQNIERTCTLKQNKSTDAEIHLEDPHHSNCHPRHTCKDHPKEQVHHPGSAPSLAQDFRGELSRQQDQPSNEPICHSQDHTTHFSQEQSIPDEDCASAIYDASNERGRVGCTCLIKRQVPEVTPLSSTFNTDATESQDNTHSPVSEAPKVHTTSVELSDDSSCSTNNSSPISRQVKHNNRNPSSPASAITYVLPSELIAVKKGTPLYGQPAWWGEELVSDQGEMACATVPKHNGDGKSASKIAGPVSHGLSGGEMDSPPTLTSALPTIESAEGDSVKPPKGCTYMEIPIRDDDSSEGLEKSKGGLVATRGRRSSLTKDNPTMSPDFKQPSKIVKTQSPCAELNPAMSFTIDLDDPEHPPKRALNIGSSISEFVPSKIRKNFKDRRSSSSKISSKESTPIKTPDEREVLPLPQSKIDEIWTTVVENKGKSRVSNIQSGAGTSLRSANLNEISQFSQSSQERRKSLENDDDKRGSVRRFVSSKSQTSQPSKVDLSSSHKLGYESPTVGGPKLVDSASYLIDKMFEGDSSFSVQTSKDHTPEHHAPTAVVSHNKVNHSSTEKDISRSLIISTCSLASVSKNIPVKSNIKQAIICNDDNEDIHITEDIASDNELREKDDREDKISEAGTYIIEADAMDGQEEEEEARRRIDEVFGVDIDNSSPPVIDPLILNEPKDYHVHDPGDDSENTILDDSQSLGDDDTDLIPDELDDETGDMTDTNGLQNWVSQLTSLTNQKSAMSNSEEESEVSLAKKLPQCIHRKRPGTGRKLPSIPSDKSPVSIDSSLLSDHQNLKTGEGLLARKSLGYDITGRRITGSSNKYMASSGQPHHSALKTGSLGSQHISAYSHGSLETDVSFQDAAMLTRDVHNLNPSKPSLDKNSCQDSDVDSSSTVALVNGSDDHVRPVLYKSPQDAVTKLHMKESPTKPNKTSSTRPAILGKNLGVKALSQTVPIPKNIPTPKSTPASTPTSGTRKSSSSDLFSRKDSLDNGSTISDVSSETGDANLSRSSSKGKVAITMTRTNKTFELRRARTDSLDEPPTPRSAKTSKSHVSSSVGKPPSLYSNLKSKSIEATNFGTQVIKKIQSHITQEKIQNSSSVSSRIDSGKHILNQGLQRASSLTISHPIPSSKRESTPKSHLRALPLGKSSLTITGISSISRGSQSQPGSRSSSPKSAEKMAWKRRKEYDARKSVADAKASKTKECSTSGVSMRSKPSASSNIDRAMTRSASFTNAAAGLTFGLYSSVSSSQDFSDRSSSHSQRKDLFKTFLPLHTAHHNGRSTRSTDEDDSIASANSTQDSARIVASLLEIPSAFTPPLAHNKDVSRENSSPSEASLTLRRRTLNMDGESSTLSRSLHVIGNERDMGHSSAGSSPQTSYDSLIVTSVYQLSQKLKTTTDRILSQLKNHGRMTQTPSPVDDFLNDSGRNEITAWKTANQELASTLKNLRMLERHMQKINVTLFPDVDASSNGSSHAPAKQQIQQKLLEDIERKYGFQPIDQPASPEMEELSGQFHNE
ncbi:hypothetical protein BsWGS_15131 [Bradybaena similaris]